MTEKIMNLLQGKGENYIFPFFWQRGEAEATIREYMKVIDEANMKAVCVESRPHPDYCGPGWWHDMDIILDEARTRGMKVWILDDSHFPTGYANGAMKGQPDELCRQSICLRSYDMDGKKELVICEKELAHPNEFQKSMVEQFVMQEEQREFHDDRLLSVYAVRLDKPQKIDLKPYIKDGELRWKVPEGTWKAYILHLSRNFGYHRDYINMMDHESCRVLIDAVYEPHFAHYKDDFGTTIAGFFSDEPELGNGHLYETDDGFGKATDLPWSRELEQRLAEELDPNYVLYLHALWEETEEAAHIRYVYMNAVTELVKENFSFQVGDWCREHGVKYIGHLIEDDNHHTRTGSSLGHYFRGLAGQDMAGIDDIGGQVFPQGEDINYNEGIFQHRNGQFYHYMLGKLGSSAAAIEPLKQGNSMCEIFGNYGWSEGVQLEKYLADHFMVRGINHFVPHAFSGKAYPDPDCPPHFYAHGHNPQYRHFGCLMAYVNRVCSLISGGRHIAPVAVVYHGEGEWTGKYMTSDVIGRLLADAQIEYDYIPQDVFTDREYYHTAVSEEILHVNTQSYRAVIVPYMQYITKDFTQAACEMSAQGVKVLFIEDFPEKICDLPLQETEEKQSCISQMKSCCQVIESDGLLEYLERLKIREIKILPSNDRIRYQHYIHENGMSLWMIINEGTECYRGHVNLLNSNNNINRGMFYRYDAWENSIRPLAIVDNEFSLEIEPLKSELIVYDPEMTPEELCKVQEKGIDNFDDKKAVPFSNIWKRSICRSIEYPKFEKEKKVELPDDLETDEPDFSGFVRYENCFEAVDGMDMYLEITDASEGVEVFLNGKSLGIQIVPVFRYRLSELVRTGRNELVIEVATTLERENAGAPDVMGQIVEAKSKSGIHGNVCLWSC